MVYTYAGSSLGVDHELMPFLWCVFPGLFALRMVDALFLVPYNNIKSERYSHWTNVLS